MSYQCRVNGFQEGHLLSYPHRMGVKVLYVGVTRIKGGRSSMAHSNISQEERDRALLQRFGYKQELRRTLGFLSNFAVAFSYISVTTGTFSLFALGILAGGPALFWTWPIVAIGQFLVALNFAELASHFPIAGSIYQWSRRLSGHSLGWFNGCSLYHPDPTRSYFPRHVCNCTGIANPGLYCCTRDYYWHAHQRRWRETDVDHQQSWCRC